MYVPTEASILTAIIGVIGLIATMTVLTYSTNRSQKYEKQLAMTYFDKQVEKEIEDLFYGDDQE